MSRSEFRYNKKRKHYAYLHKDFGDIKKNILLSSKPVIKFKKKRKIKYRKNVHLFRHPSRKIKGEYYVIPKNYYDDIDSFDERIYEDWSFDKNDKGKIKRIKKMK